MYLAIDFIQLWVLNCIEVTIVRIGLGYRQAGGSYSI